jgi:hypothetical protein
MATYKPLQTVTLTSDTTSVTFSGIDQNYTDLVLVASAKAVSTGDDLGLRFNGDASTSSYSYVFLTGNGSTATRRVGNGYSSITLDYNGGATSTEHTVHILNIFNYTSTTMYKTTLGRTNSSTGVDAGVYLWRATPQAITSITVLMQNTGVLAAGSTFSLYGIKSGTPKALGGDQVFTDGTYWYHVFKTSGTFAAQGSALSVDALVVAGGGGAGGGNVSGGGGAGGYRTLTGLSFPGQTTVLVGAGGTGVADNDAGRSSGTNSSFANITSTGGGVSSTAGGSGGGSNRDGSSTAGTGNAGGYSPVEGYAGGQTSSGIYQGAGGGGGAGGAGVGGTGGSQTGEKGGAGGIGAYTAISGGSTTGAGVLSGGNYYFAGGGGGGTESGARNGVSLGGTGGGGNGSQGNATAATSGTANTGGGGGGAGYSSGKGGNGGSGIVIVRYAV